MKTYTLKPLYNKPLNKNMCSIEYNLSYLVGIQLFHITKTFIRKYYLGNSSLRDNYF